MNRCPSWLKSELNNVVTAYLILSLSMNFRSLVFALRVVDPITNQRKLVAKKYILITLLTIFFQLSLRLIKINNSYIDSTLDLLTGLSVAKQLTNFYRYSKDPPITTSNQQLTIEVKVQSCGPYHVATARQVVYELDATVRYFGHVHTVVHPPHREERLWVPCAAGSHSWS